MEDYKNFRLIGIYFILLELSFLVVFISYEKIYPPIFWACNLIPIFIALGFFTKDTQLIKASINFEFIPQLIFTILTIIYIITDISLIGIKGNYEIFLIGFVALWLHALSVNVALFYTRKMKTTKKSLVYSIIILLLVYILTLLFTPPFQNVNFTRLSEDIIGFNFPFLIFLWPILAFIFLVYPTYLFQKFLANH